MTSRIPPRALDPAGATAGQVPTVGTGATKVEWADPPAGGGGGNLDGLSDVDTTTTPPADAQGLRFDAASGLWVPGNFALTGHSHTRSQITDAGTAIAYNAPSSGDAAASEVVLGSDTRLTPTVSFEVAEGATFQTFPGTTFAVVGYSTVVKNVGGGTWDATNKTWAVPVKGLYLCVGRLRAADGTTNRNFGHGIHTTSTDGPWVIWQDLTFSRSGLQVVRVAEFNAGDLLRHFGYNDGAALTLTSGSFSATLLART